MSVAQAEIDNLRDLLGKATQGDWHAGHLADDDHPCGCRYVLSEGYMGAVATVDVGNGLPISEGGNDAPPLDEAKANLALIAAMKNALPGLLDEVEARRERA